MVVGRGGGRVGHFRNVRVGGGLVVEVEGDRGRRDRGGGVGGCVNYHGSVLLSRGLVVGTRGGRDRDVEGGRGGVGERTHLLLSLVM